jgi:hypothetical protein
MVPRHGARPRLVQPCSTGRGGSALGILVVALLACAEAPPVAQDARPADASEPLDASGSPEAGADVGEVVDSGVDGGADPPPCEPRNDPELVRVRDGFVEVCADRTTHARAVCGDGTPFRFSYRRATGESAGLLVYFRGGGNCTDYVSCWGVDGRGGAGRRVSTLGNTRTAPEVLPELGRTFGVFDRVDVAALFPDFDVLYVSYCSGDGGLASTEETFSRPPEADASAPATITTYFRGIDNRRAALAWAAAEFVAPARVVVWGSSAGAYASLGAVPDIAAAWAAARDVTWWGEGGVGVGRASFDALFSDTLAQFDGEAGRRLVRFVQFSFTSDAMQVSYAPPPFDSEAAFRAELRRTLEARAARAPRNYRYVAAPGRCHTLALEPALYQAFRRVGMGWQPVVPAARPNPELVFEGLSVVSSMREATRGSGPFDATFPNRSPDWSLASDRCELPRGDRL